MRIAVCDDQKESLDVLDAMLKNMKRAEYIKTYNGIDMLMEDLKENELFDVIIMDIQWNQAQNGIDFASHINTYFPNIKIIYITGYNEKYSQEIFLKNSNLAGYVKKPVDPDILSANIERAWKLKQEEEQKKLIVTYKNRPTVILNRDILYIESRGHKAFIHTKKEEIVCYEKLIDLQKRLESNFIFCHKSYLVNMEEISRMEKYKMIFFNGTELQISKNKYDETRKSFFRYLGRDL